MNQKRVFITGVSSGIGHGLAAEYLEQGWEVFGVSRRTPDFDSSQFHFQPLDVTDEAAVPGVLEKLLAGVPMLDHVVLLSLIHI